MKGDGSPFDFTPIGGAWNGARCGVLCIHGFTGTPFEMRLLAERLQRHGFHAVGPALPGHLVSPEQLDETTWHDWYGAVERAFDELRARCDHVAVVGQSLGGLLALHLARERGAELAAVASLAAPLSLPRLATWVIRATRPGSRAARLVRQVPKLGGSDVRDGQMRQQNPSYSAVPLRALHQLHDFMGIVAGELGDITVPVLVVHARHDHTAPYASSEQILAGIGSRTARHCALERSYHLVSLDVEREVVAAEVSRFFDARFRIAGALA